MDLVFFERTFIASWLNNITAEFAALIFSLLTRETISVVENSFGNQSFRIEVKYGCSPISQIILTAKCISGFLFMLQIEFLLRLLSVCAISVTIAFVCNSLRITILAHITYFSNTENFEFWHSGTGSLIFSFIIMFINYLFITIFGVKKTPLIDEITNKLRNYLFENIIN